MQSVLEKTRTWEDSRENALGQRFSAEPAPRWGCGNWWKYCCY